MVPEPVRANPYGLLGTSDLMEGPGEGAHRILLKMLQKSQNIAFGGLRWSGGRSFTDNLKTGQQLCGNILLHKGTNSCFKFVEFSKISALQWLYQTFSNHERSIVKLPCNSFRRNLKGLMRNRCPVIFQPSLIKDNKIVCLLGGGRRSGRQRLDAKT